VINISKTNMKW